MTINLHLPSKSQSLRPSITVVGVGGAGGNAVNNMISSNLEGVNFVVANTDAQALEHSLAERRIQLGTSITRGLGAGAMPEVGRQSAEEAIDEIESYIEGSNMVFIAAGMGGGTGTGAAPVVARLAKERGILTVGIVTKPFQFEGLHRMRLADQGVRDLQEYVDTLIVIPNQNLFRIINERTPFAEAFRMADEVLHSGVRGVTDLIVMPGLINLDFADIRTVMREMGKAMMGTGEAEGPKRAIEAAEAAIQNPLLDDSSMKGAKGVLINITGGSDMTMFEADEVSNRIRAEVDPNANIIFGAAYNPNMEGRIRVSVVATGIELENQEIQNKPTQQTVNAVADTQRVYAGSVGFGRPEQKVARSSTSISVDAVREPVRQVETPVRSQPETTRTHSVHQDVVIAPKSHSSENAVYHEPVYTNREQQQDVTAASRSEGPSFISPQAAQPAQRSFLTQQEDMLSFAAAAPKIQPQVAPQQNYERLETTREASVGSSAMGFFQRMARVKEALTSSSQSDSSDAQSRPARSPDKGKMELAKNEPRKEESPSSERTTVKQVRPGVEDDYLDIPAFLRRQAN